MLPEGICVPCCMIKPATEHTWQLGTGATWPVTLPGRSLGISDYSQGCAAQGTRVYTVLEGLHPVPAGTWGGASTGHAWPCHMGGPTGKNQTEGTGQKRSCAHSDTPHSSAQSSYGIREKIPHLTGYPSCREDLCLGTQAHAGLLYQQLGPSTSPESGQTMLGHSG